MWSCLKQQNCMISVNGMNNTRRRRDEIHRWSRQSSFSLGWLARRARLVAFRLCVIGAWWRSSHAAATTLPTRFFLFLLELDITAQQIRISDLKFIHIIGVYDSADLLWAWLSSYQTAVLGWLWWYWLILFRLAWNRLRSTIVSLHGHLYRACCLSSLIKLG